MKYMEVVKAVEKLVQESLFLSSLNWKDSFLWSLIFWYVYFNLSFIIFIKNEGGEHS